MIELVYLVMSVGWGTPAAAVYHVPMSRAACVSVRRINNARRYNDWPYVDCTTSRQRLEKR